MSEPREPMGWWRSVGLAALLFVWAYFFMIGSVTMCEDLGVYDRGGDRWGKYRVTFYILAGPFVALFVVRRGRRPSPR